MLVLDLCLVLRTINNGLDLGLGFGLISLILALIVLALANVDVFEM